MFYLSDDEFSQVWGTYGRGNYTIRVIHSLRIYRQFSRRMLLRCGTRSGERARGRNRKLKNREQSRELVIINEVIDMASIQVRFCPYFSFSSFRAHSPFPTPRFPFLILATSVFWTLQIAPLHCETLTWISIVNWTNSLFYLSITYFCSFCTTLLIKMLSWPWPHEILFKVITWRADEQETLIQLEDLIFLLLHYKHCKCVCLICVWIN